MKDQEEQIVRMVSEPAVSQLTPKVCPPTPPLSDGCIGRASSGLCDLRSPQPQECSVQAQRSVRWPHGGSRGSEGQTSQPGS